MGIGEITRMNPFTNESRDFTLKTLRRTPAALLKLTARRSINVIFISSVLHLGRIVYPGSSHDRGSRIGEPDQQSSRKELRTGRLLGAKATSQVGRLSTLQSIPTLPHRRRASAEKKRLEMNTFLETFERRVISLPLFIFVLFLYIKTPSAF